MIQLIIWSKVSFWFTKGISLQQRNSREMTECEGIKCYGIFCSNLDLKTAGEKPSLPVFVEIFILATSICSLLLEYDVSQLSIEFVDNSCHRHFSYSALWIQYTILLTILPSGHSCGMHWSLNWLP